MTHTTMEPGRPAPVAEKDRIRNLDMLRGWAVLGILAVNAVAFAWPFLVMMSETLPPIEATHADRVGWWVIDVFFADKMRTLFTMLFGVSVFLVGGERSDLDRGALLRKRLLWLGLFGLIHGLAFWYGDILLHYAYCGFIFLMFRSWSAGRLLWVGGGITVFWALVASASYWGMANLPPEFAAKMTQGRPEVSPETVQAVVDAYLGGYVGVLGQNAQAWLTSALFFPFLILVTVPLMMLGLGLFKSGFLSGKSPTWVYLLILALGGANLAAAAIWGWQKHFAPEGTDPTLGLAAAATGAAPLITLFYVSALILLSKWGLKALTGIFVPVGRMAFTNYLTQTLIMTTVYYMPWGPKLMGQHGPAEWWLVVIGVWIAQIIWSPLWLKAFTMGPLEWLWRRLTYAGPVPLRRVG